MLFQELHFLKVKTLKYKVGGLKSKLQVQIS